MVADVYGSNISQGPALPTSNRSTLLMPLMSNPALFRSRMVAAINTVKHSSFLLAVSYWSFAAMYWKGWSSRLPQKETQLLLPSFNLLAAIC